METLFYSLLRSADTVCNTLGSYHSLQTAGNQVILLSKQGFPTPTPHPPLIPYPNCLSIQLLKVCRPFGSAIFLKHESAATRIIWSIYLNYVHLPWYIINLHYLFCFKNLSQLFCLFLSVVRYHMIYQGNKFKAYFFTSVQEERYVLEACISWLLHPQRVDLSD